MVAWPATLPQKQFIGLTDRRQDARLRTPMDKGPPKMRRRFTAAVRNIAVPIVLNGTQKSTFDTFYKTTLQEGALPFDWDDPVTDAAVSFTFGQNVPEFRLEVSGATPDDRIWIGSLDLEILP